MVPRIDVRRESAMKHLSGELGFSFEAEGGLIDVPYVEFSSPVKAQLGYEIFANGKVEVEGTISFSLKGLCSRCLSEAEEEVTFHAEGVFSPDPKDDEYGYLNVIDLGEFLRDSVLFALPPRLLCRACAEDESE